MPGIRASRWAMARPAGLVLVLVPVLVLAAAWGAPPASAPEAPEAPAVPAPAGPALDLQSLEARLRQTDAIGVFTKLALKNQIDDLLERFRAVHQGRTKATLAELRRPFNLLVTKVLALLQDRDPPLAQAVVASREPLWAWLSDPEQLTGPGEASKRGNS